jgi:hypothetical protein
MTSQLYRRASLLAALVFVFLALPAELPELIPFRKGSAWGYCNRAGELQIAAAYDAAMPFRDGRAVVFKAGKAGLIDASGFLLLPTIYDNILFDDLLRLRKGDLFALAAADGSLLTGFDYEQIFPQRSGLFLVEADGRYGMVDTAGVLVVPPEYGHVRSIRDRNGNFTDLIAVREGNLLGLYDRCGNLISEPRYTRIDVFREGFAVVQRNYRFGLIDLEGHEVIEAAYDNLHPVSEGLCAASVRGIWGFMDTGGETAVPFRYTAVQESGFFQGRAAVQARGEWIFIDRKGDESMPLKGPYRSLGRLSDGMTAVAVLDEVGQAKYGYLDHKGRNVIACEYDRAYPFREGFAVVGKRSSLRNSLVEKMRFGVVDRKGKAVLPLVLTSETAARIKRDSLAIYGWVHFQNGESHCMVDSKGRISDCKMPAERKLMLRYQQTRCEQKSLVAVARDGLWGFCDRNGREVIGLKYRDVGCFEDGLAMVWPVEGDEFFYVDEGGREYVGLE